MSSVRADLVSTLLCFASVAAAAPKAKPELGDNHEPKVFLDPATTKVWLHPTAKKYTLKGEFVLAGSVNAADRFRMNVLSGGKVIGSVDCGMDTIHDDADMKWRYVSCSAEDLKAMGALDIDLIFIDDKTDKEFVAATLKTIIKPAKSGTENSFAITPDDLLALAWASAYRGMYDHVPITFWTTKKPETTTVLRCSVSGKQLDDITGDISEQDNFSSGDGGKFSYTRVKFDGQLLVGLNPKPGSGGVPHLGDHPGKWDCALRENGKVLRQLMFEVTDKGEIAPSPMQSGKSPIRTLTGEFLLDSRIPAQNNQLRIRPDALKKSIGYGVPWPDGPGAKEAQAAFPSSVGKD